MKICPVPLSICEMQIKTARKGFSTSMLIKFNFHPPHCVYVCVSVSVCVYVFLLPLSLPPPPPPLFLVTSRIDPRALHMLGKCSSPELYRQKRCILRMMPQGVLADTIALADFLEIVSESY